MKKMDDEKVGESFHDSIGKLILKILGRASGEKFEKLQSGLHAVPELIADDRRRKEIEIRGEDRVEEDRR